MINYDIIVYPDSIFIHLFYRKIKFLSYKQTNKIIKKQQIFISPMEYVKSMESKLISNLNINNYSGVNVLIDILNIQKFFYNTSYVSVFLRLIYS